MSWFDEIITPEERREVDEAVQDAIAITLITAGVAIRALPEYLEARWGLGHVERP